MLSRPGRLAFDGAPRPNLKALNLKRQTSSSLVRPPLLSSNKDGTRSRARADTVEKASISALIIGPIQIIAPHSPSSFFVRPARSLSLTLTLSRCSLLTSPPPFSSFPSCYLSLPAKVVTLCPTPMPPPSPLQWSSSSIGLPTAELQVLRLRRMNERTNGLHDTLSLPLALPLPLPRRRRSSINSLCPRWCATARCGAEAVATP